MTTSPLQVKLTHLGRSISAGFLWDGRSVYSRYVLSRSRFSTGIHEAEFSSEGFISLAVGHNPRWAYLHLIQLGEFLNGVLFRTAKTCPVEARCIRYWLGHDSLTIVRSTPTTATSEAGFVASTDGVGCLTDPTKLWEHAFYCHDDPICEGLLGPVQCTSCYHFHRWGWRRRI